MQKLIVKNFGPLTEVELPIRDFTILIGQNGSGKSLLAKLVYFFNEIPEILTETLFVKNSVFAAEESNVSLEEKIFDRLFEKQLPALFRTLFGSKEFFRSESEIIFEWESGIRICVTSSDHFLADFRLDNSTKEQFLILLKHSEASDSEISFPSERHIIEKISSFFGNRGQRQFTRFIPENRGAFNFYDHYFQSSAYDHQLQVINDPLTTVFEDQFHLEKKFWRTRKRAVQVYERDWKLYIVQDVDLGTKTQSEVEALQSFHTLFSEVIQGEFLVKNGAEFIQLESGELIPTDRVSSGQKEAIGVIPIMFDDLMYHRTTFSVIEEPEAHLYPKTQQKIAQQLAAFFNGSNGGRLLVTTHSPYLLSSLNNLLFAFKSGLDAGKAQKVHEIIAEKYWLDPMLLSVYGVGYGDEQQSIVSLLANNGLINAEPVDEASDLIGDDFDLIMEIYRNPTNVS